MFDLHTHSNCSDGILRPQELVSRAKAQGVTTLALTDHDTVHGIAEAQQQAQLEGIELIPGVEFSTQWSGINVHIVGLNVDPEAPSIQQGAAHQLQIREERAVRIAEKLEKAGLPNIYKGAKALAGDAMVGRPHFARYLVEIGKVKTVNQAFQKYLGAGKPGDVKQLWPEIPEVVEWITAAGGVAVMAHPDKYKMTRTKLRRCLDDFIEAGGRAIEVINGNQAPNLTRDMAKLAELKGLYASCGSDFHVPDQPWQELGRIESLPDGCVPVWQAWQ